MGGGSECNFQLQIPNKEIKRVYKNITKNYEVSGVLKYNKDNTFQKTTIQKGEETSVYTPNHVINFHTHPTSAYINNETVWGWPSGEDMRESIKFGLAGNKGHLVFSVEGVYTIQLNPCKIKAIRENLSDDERGILIFMLEEYFKTTHNFRCVEEVNKLSQTRQFINPYTYIDFVNNFELKRLMSLKDTDLSKKQLKQGDNFSKLPSTGFPEVSGNKVSSSPFNKYLTKDDIQSIDLIGADGSEKGVLSNKSMQDIMKTLKVVFKKLNEVNCINRWNNQSDNNKNLWFYMKLFESEYYKNNCFFDKHNQVYTSPKSIYIKQITPKSETKVYLRIFSNNKDGCSIKQVEEKNNFFGNSAITKTSKSTFGYDEITPKQKHLLYTYIFKQNHGGVTLTALKKSGLTNYRIKREVMSINTLLQNLHRDHHT
jgi:hypothetical protein